MDFREELHTVLEEKLQEEFPLEDLEKKLIEVVDYGKVVYIEGIGNNKTVLDTNVGIPDLIENFDYDDGYGSQKVFGLLVFKDGSWLDRDEYDGSEEWVLRFTPTREEVFE